MQLCERVSRNEIKCKSINRDNIDICWYFSWIERNKAIIIHINYAAEKHPLFCYPFSTSSLILFCCIGFPVLDCFPLLNYREMKNVEIYWLAPDLGCFGFVIKLLKISSQAQNVNLMRKLSFMFPHNYNHTHILKVLLLLLLHQSQHMQEIFCHKMILLKQHKSS